MQNANMSFSSSSSTVDEIDDAFEAERASVIERLFSLRAGAMLVRNTVVSTAAFLLGIALLWLMVQRLGIDKYVAATVSFIAANSLHYAFGRLWIFAGSGRPIASGYLYFFLNAGVGLGVTIALFAFFTEIAGLNYLIARVVASVFAGLAMFALNAVVNFRSL